MYHKIKLFALNFFFVLLIAIEWLLGAVVAISEYVSETVTVLHKLIKDEASRTAKPD